MLLTMSKDNFFLDTQYHSQKYLFFPRAVEREEAVDVMTASKNSRVIYFGIHKLPKNAPIDDEELSMEGKAF